MFVLISGLHRTDFTYTRLPSSPFRTEYFLRMSWLLLLYTFCKEQIDLWLSVCRYVHQKEPWKHVTWYWGDRTQSEDSELWAPLYDQLQSCCLGEEMRETEMRRWNKHPRSLSFLRIAHPCASAVRWTTGCAEAFHGCWETRTLSTMAIMEDVISNWQDGWVKRCLSTDYLWAHLWWRF